MTADTRFCLQPTENDRLRFTAARFARIVERVRHSGIALPPLCPCPHARHTDPMATSYTSKCATNCPLRDDPDEQEHLLAHILHSYGFGLVFS